MERMAPGTVLPEVTHAGGAKIFVLEGNLADEDGVYPKGTWIRLPEGYTHTMTSHEGCLIYKKSGHLCADKAA